MFGPSMDLNSVLSPVSVLLFIFKFIAVQIFASYIFIIFSIA